MSQEICWKPDCSQRVVRRQTPSNIHSSSNHLKNWEEWQEKRMRLFYNLYKKTGRRPGELLLNYGDEFRKVQEERTRIEYTRINTNFDKYRGNPAFWLLPDTLNEHTDEDPLYFAFQALPKRNIIPPMERVATPTFALKEKRAYPILRSIYTKWKMSGYREQQLQKLSSKLKKVEPHIPDPSSLYVIGERLFGITVQEAIDQTVKTSLSSLDRFLSSCFEEDPIISRLCLNVNEIIVVSSDDIFVTCPKIKYYFHYSDLKTPVSETLVLKNDGRTTVRMIWQKVEKYCLFREETETKAYQDSCFYFGKEEIIVAPGNTEKIPLWFLPRRHGIFLEKWTFRTIPKIPDERFDLIIIFQSLTDDEKCKKNEERIKKSIENGVRNTLIKECLIALMDEFVCEVTFPKILHVSQQQLMECRNIRQLFGLRKSAYTFTESRMDYLRDFYSEIKQPSDPVLDNLSVANLKFISKRADIINYVKEKTKQFETIAHIREDCEHSIMDSICLNKEFSWRSEPDLASEKLKNILSKFETPLMNPNYEKHKHVIAFNVIRSYFMNIPEDLETSDYLPCINLRSLKRNLPLRWANETFFDMWIPKTQYIAHDAHFCSVTPKPRILERIPQEDVNEIYSVYWSKIIEKSDEDSVDSETSTSPESEINSSYQSSYSARTNDVVNYESNQVNSGDTFDGLNYSRYLLFYTMLQRAIDAMIDAIESFKESNVAEDLLEEILECGKPQHFEKQELEVHTFEETSAQNYFESLLNLTLLKNKNVMENILKEDFRDFTTEDKKTHEGMNLDQVISSRIMRSYDKYEKLFRQRQ